MAQEFRIFTQRVTRKPTLTDRILNQGETELFNVRAKTLVDQFGNDIVDSKGNKIWFPESFDPADAIGFGKSIAALPSPLRGLVMYYNFRQGGPRELQRTYNGQSDGPFAEAFTRAASYALGLTGAAASYSQEDLMKGGGLWKNPKTADRDTGNNPRNVPFIAQGFRDHFASVFAPRATIPVGSFRGNPALAMPADRFKMAFDHSLNGAPDSFNWLAASMINGNVAPAVGFGDYATGESHSGSLPAKIVTSAPTLSGRWLDSMIRNGEVERIAGSGGIAPSPAWRATPAFEPDAVHSPDGYFAGNFPTAFPAIASPAVPSSKSAPSQDRHDPFDSRFRGWGSSPADAYGRDQSNASVFDAGAPPIRYLPSRITSSSPDRRNSLGSASDPFSPDTPGGLAGRIAALAGIDPANPDPRELTPPGNGFYHDELPEHWLFRALTGRLR